MLELVQHIQQRGLPALSSLNKHHHPVNMSEERQLQLCESGSYPFLQVNTTLADLEGKELSPSEPDSALLNFRWVGEGVQNGLLFFQRELLKWYGSA